MQPKQKCKIKEHTKKDEEFSNINNVTGTLVQIHPNEKSARRTTAPDDTDPS